MQKAQAHGFTIGGRVGSPGVYWGRKCQKYSHYTGNKGILSKGTCDYEKLLQAKDDYTFICMARASSSGFHAQTGAVDLSGDS
jgi:hypothetical protein